MQGGEKQPDCGVFDADRRINVKYLTSVSKRNSGCELDHASFSNVSYNYFLKMD
jgi:hypothetical protein